TAQAWLLGHVLGLEPAGEDERPVQRTQDHKWNLNLAAARQYREREGHLNVPRKHIEQLDDGQEVKLGMWIDNTRRRATKLSIERRADLDQLDMHWREGVGLVHEP
ncbi:helicase associated domain-containing protein, partial [Streptomyces sp. NPDC005480]|uniref:helicase associated domain-containing protein n=1 Tax=Streptomyces sp. NPDC005480 TaxID=3154880 RepID=UPI0033BE4847